MQSLTLLDPGDEKGGGGVCVRARSAVGVACEHMPIFVSVDIVGSCMDRKFCAFIVGKIAISTPVPTSLACRPAGIF